MLPYKVESMVLGQGGDAILFLSGATDPTTGGGVAASLNSLYWQLGAASLWRKVGPADTDWVLMALGPPVQQETAPLEAMTASQLITQMGYGHPMVCRLWNTLNGPVGPLFPEVGPGAFVGSAGATANVQGPIDSFDKGVVATLAQSNGQWTMGTGLINPANQRFIMVSVVEFLAGAGAAARSWLGHAGVNDFIHQITATTNRLRIITGGTYGSATAELPIDLFAAAGPHVVVSGWKPELEMRVCCELGISPATNLTAFTNPMTWGSGLFIHRNNAAANALVTDVGFFVSDGSPTQDAILDDMYLHMQDIAQNLFTVWGL